MPPVVQRLYEFTNHACDRLECGGIKLGLDLYLTCIFTVNNNVLSLFCYSFITNTPYGKTDKPVLNHRAGLVFDCRILFPELEHLLVSWVREETDPAGISWDPEVSTCPEHAGYA